MDDGHKFHDYGWCMDYIHLFDNWSYLMVKIYTDDEMKELTQIGFNLIKKVKKLRNTVIEEHDEGEECPLCGTEYAIPDLLFEQGAYSVECPNGMCIFNEVALEIKKLGAMYTLCISIFGMTIENHDALLAIDPDYSRNSFIRGECK